MHDFVRDRARLDLPGPAHHRRNAPTAFPVCVLLTTEWGRRSIGPGIVVGTVVGRIEDDRVVGNSQFVKHLEELSDVHVVFDHAVGILVLA